MEQDGVCSGGFRVVFFAAINTADDCYTSEVVQSYEIARLILESLADYTLHLHESELMEDFSNTGWIEQCVNGEWVEVLEEENEE